MPLEETSLKQAIRNLVKGALVCDETDAEIIWHIYKNPGCTPTGLTETIHYAARTIQERLKEIEKKGLVHRCIPYLHSRGAPVPLYLTVSGSQLLIYGSFLPTERKVALGCFIKNESTNKRLFWLRKTPPLENTWGIFFKLIGEEEYKDMKYDPSIAKQKLEQFLDIEIKGDISKIYDQPAAAMKKDGIPVANLVVYDVKSTQVKALETELKIDFVDYVKAHYFTRKEYIEGSHELLVMPNRGIDRRIDDLVEVLMDGEKLEGKDKVDDYLKYRAIKW